jgi:superfamily II DNA/RNA helicase
VKPVLTFEQAAFPEEMTRELEKHYNLPTPIQSQTWPFLLNGQLCRDGKVLNVGLSAFIF